MEMSLYSPLLLRRLVCMFPGAFMTIGKSRLSLFSRILIQNGQLQLSHLICNCTCVSYKIFVSYTVVFRYSSTWFMRLWLELEVICSNGFLNLKIKIIHTPILFQLIFHFVCSRFMIPMFDWKWSVLTIMLYSSCSFSTILIFPLTISFIILL